MIDRYVDRPNDTFKDRKYAIIDQLCYAKFFANYYLKPNLKDIQNVNQPEVLTDEVMQENNQRNSLPKTIPLMSSKETLSCRKVKAVVRYHCSKMHKHPEGYAHYHLFMYYPLRNEAELFGKESGAYTEKLSEPGIIDIVNQNKQIFQPYTDLVETALRNVRSSLLNNPDPSRNRKMMK